MKSYAFAKKDIQNAKMLKPSEKKLRDREAQGPSSLLQHQSSLHSKYAQSALAQSKRKAGQMLHFSTDSNNTILELNHDSSKGGHSAGLAKINQNSSSYAASNFSNGDTNKLIPSSDQKNLHLSLVMRGEEDLITPRGKLRINNDLSTKNHKTLLHQHNQSHRKKELTAATNESPFIKIVTTTAKNIFGNFFKTQDKLNKSYEEYQAEFSLNAGGAGSKDLKQGGEHPNKIQPSFDNEILKKQARSKSIHQSVLTPNYRDSPEIRVTTQTYQSNQNNKKQSPYMSLGSSNHKRNREGNSNPLANSA